MIKILITRHDKIGDFVVSLPMFKALKEQKKDIKLYALVSKINFDFAKNINFIDEVILYDKNNLSKTLKDIKEENIDISISAFIDTSLAWLLFRSGIKTRIAPATKIAQLLFNKRVTQRRSRVEKREFEYNLDLLKAYDSKLLLSYSYPLLNFSDNEKNRVLNSFKKQFKVNCKDHLIAFHPGSGGSTDGNLKLDDYLLLAKECSIVNNTKIVFTFGPDDLELKNELNSKLDFDAIIYESKSSIMDFCKLLASFDLFISTSTGPMHLAAANNITTVSFFGSKLVATPKRWASINEDKKQFNFVLEEDYSIENYKDIETCVLGLLTNE